MQKLEDARRRRNAQERFNFSEDDLAELETRCILARLPKYLVATYRLANEAGSRSFSRTDISFDTPSAGMLHRQERLLCNALIQRSAELLAASVWHPWLTALYVYRANRRLLAALHEVFPFIELSARSDFSSRLMTWWRDRKKFDKQNEQSWRDKEQEWRKEDSGDR